jgi:hypothetical protein
MLFAKSAKQNYSTEIFRISKVIKRRPRPLYELHDLNDTPIDGQFYQEELSDVRISKQFTRWIKYNDAPNVAFGKCLAVGKDIRNF